MCLVQGTPIHVQGTPIHLQRDHHVTHGGGTASNTTGLQGMRMFDWLVNATVNMEMEVCLPWGGVCMLAQGCNVGTPFLNQPSERER